MDFIGEPKDTPRRLENGTGIFQDYIVNQEGVKIHIILVDVRYNFDKKTRERYGDLQTQWLEEIFKNQTDADITLIGMGV